jgi:type IV pilus assembly protein PilC
MRRQRQFRRIPFSCDVRVADSAGAKGAAGRTVDISVDGVGIALTAAMISKDALVTIAFRLVDAGGRTVTERVAGRVVFTRGTGEGSFLGVKFVDQLSPATCPELSRRVERAAGAEESVAFEGWVAAHARTSSRPHRGVKMDDKMTFFHQLSTLISSGTPLLQAIKICAEQNQSLKMRRTLDEIAGRIAAGSALNVAAAGYPHIFEHQWIEVIKTGEVTGKMSGVLLELNAQIRDARETHRKVVGALMYPMILIVVAVIAVTVMLWMVVPTFAKLFHDMGATLPAITQFVVDASGAVVAYGPYAAVAIAAAAYGFRRFMKTETGRRIVGGIGLVLPMVGDLLVQMAMYRFASNIALLLKSGVPMLETLTTLCSIFGNSPIYRRALHHAQGRVAAGRPLAASLEETGLFPSMMTSMVRIGEESGQLAVVMEQIAPYYKQKMETMVQKVTKLLEPVIIMGMGGTIAGLMLAIYMPMFEMAGKVN